MKIKNVVCNLLVASFAIQNFQPLFAVENALMDSENNQSEHSVVVNILPTDGSDDQAVEVRIETPAITNETTASEQESPSCCQLLSAHTATALTSYIATAACIGFAYSPPETCDRDSMESPECQDYLKTHFYIPLIVSAVGVQAVFPVTYFGYKGCKLVAKKIKNFTNRNQVADASTQTSAPESN